jgi:Domain of unknown function (DUF4234)
MATFDETIKNGPDAPPPSGPYGATTPGILTGASRQMKLRNPILVWLVWPIITFGIYHFVWYYKIHDELLRLDPRQPIKPAGSLLTILFGWIIIVPPFVSYFNTGNRITTAQRASGLAPTANPWIGFILLFIFGLTPLYYQFDLNKIVTHLGVPEGATVTLIA